MAPDGPCSRVFIDLGVVGRLDPSLERVAGVDDEVDDNRSESSSLQGDCQQAKGRVSKLALVV